MCSAMGMAMAGFQAISGFSNNIQQQQAAIAQQQLYAMQKQVEWDINKRKADNEATMRQAAGIINMQQLEARQQEINEAATEDKSEIQIAAMRAKAAAELQAGEAGVGGNSVKRLLANIESEATRRTNNVESTRENQIAAAQINKIATRQGTKMQPIYGILPSAGSGKVNYLSAALSGVGAGIVGADLSAIFNGKKSQTSSTMVKNPKYS